MHALGSVGMYDGVAAAVGLQILVSPHKYKFPSV